MDNKFKSKFQTGDSVKILLSLIPSDKKEYAIEGLTFCNYHQTKAVIDRVLVDINNASVDYVVSITYEDNTKKVVLVPEKALEAAEVKGSSDNAPYPVPPKANIGEYVGIIPTSTTRLDTEKHIEMLKVKAIDYSYETHSFSYTIEDESGAVKVIPERPTDDTYVENMSYICSLLDDLRKNKKRTNTCLGRKVIMRHCGTSFLPYQYSGRVIRAEELYNQSGIMYATYIDSRSGKKVATLLGAIEPLKGNAPKFEEGQIVCVRDSYALTHNKYKILSIYASDIGDESQRYAALVEKVGPFNGGEISEETAFFEKDLMLAHTTVKVRKRQDTKV